MAENVESIPISEEKNAEKNEGEKPQKIERPRMVWMKFVFKVRTTFY